jgi:acetyltransferase
MDSLDRLFRPQSFAVVGASNNEDKVGYHLLYAMRKFPGQLYPINPKASEIQGIKAYPNLKAVEAPIDIAALCIPARACLGAIKEAGEAGVGVAFIAGGGFGEADEQGQTLQDEIAAACKEYHVRLLGPNTSGFVNPKLGVTANFNPLVSNFVPGNIAIVSQSGAMSVVIGTVVQTNRLGISVGVGLGNAPDIAVPEVLEYLIDHEETKAIAVYLEGVTDGRRLYEAIHKTTQKKPVVVFTVGKANIGDFAASHTGKMIGSFALKKAALTQAGAVVVSSSNDLIDAAHALSKARLAPNPNPGVGILTGQAGPAMTMTDYLRNLSIDIPELEPATIEAISKELPIKTYIKNPVDTARPLHHIFENVLTSMSKDPNIDLLLTYAMHEPMCVEPIKLYQSLKRVTAKPMLFSTSGLPEDLAPIMRDLESMDIPAYVSPDRTAIAAWALVEDAKAAFRKQRPADTGQGPARVETIGRNPDEAEAKELLSAIGIGVPKRMVCADYAAARTAFSDLKKPCVVKILSAAVSHKTEMGGVHLNIETEDQLAAALQKIDAIDVPGNKQYLLEEMAPQGLEVIIGGKNDPSFGAVVMLGLGGTAAEAFGDVAMRVAPLTTADAMDMIAELKTSALFDAWRGGPNYDKEAVADALVKIGRLMAGHPEIKEMDLNPVRVYPQGALALDALIVCA